MIAKNNEKQLVAFSSVLAALFLVTIKAAVGFATGSLGIISEAAHSALDLGAAVVTLFAVRISDKPPDAGHTYGHGKVESFSALIETLLLLATCGWIIYEAFERLLFGKSIAVINTGWGIGVMVLSIVIDISRSRALKSTAVKFNSQALEADALHFSSDVWSSLVVIAGLACAGLGTYLDIAFLHYADPVAALGVALLVIVVSLKLGKRTIDVLLDTTPQGMTAEIFRAVREIQGVLDIASVRVRPSGPLFFIDLNVGISKNESHRVVHSIVHEIRTALTERFPNSDIVISTYPVDVAGIAEKETYQMLKKIVDQFPVCTNIHNIHVYDVSGKRHIAVHIEVKENLNLEASHELSHKITALIQQQLPDVRDVHVTFETAKQRHIMARDLTEQSADLIGQINRMINRVPERLNCHDIKVYSQGGKVSVFLHCGLKKNYQSDQLEKLTKNISRRIKKTFSRVDSVHIHVEPINAGSDGPA
jgi:cation diffusion facilitator family transporter